MKKTRLFWLLTAVCFIALILLLLFADRANGENKLDSLYDSFLYFYNQNLAKFDKENPNLINWIFRWDELDAKGVIIDDQGNWIIRVYVIIDPKGQHFLIPTPKEVEAAKIVITYEDTETTIKTKAKVAADSAIAAYKNFINEQIAAQKLKKPSKELMFWWNIFEPRLLEEIKFNSWLYNEFLGWKAYFPVQFENKVFVKVETKNYPKGKTFRSALGKAQKETISNICKTVAEVMIWIENVLKEGLEKKVLILPEGFTVGFPDGKCFGAGCPNQEQNPPPKPKKSPNHFI